MRIVYASLLGLVLLFNSCHENTKGNSTKQSKTDQKKPVKVATFKGQQVTGVSVSSEGKVFANFPRWRTGVANAVVVLDSLGNPTPYPSKQWNTWEVGQPITDSVFVGIQSVVAHHNKLYVLDTRNALWKGVMDAPRIFVFNLTSNTLEDMYTLSADSYKQNSYINDLRIDPSDQYIYMTDSNESALVVYNIKERSSKRVLDNHFSTQATLKELDFNGTKWGNPVHSDGIALNTKNNRLYYHSLTGYDLYSVSTSLLQSGTEEAIANDVRKEAVTGAPDGMIFDAHQNLYLANLEKGSIDILKPNDAIATFYTGNEVRWADTFSIYNDDLYYTNSRINEVQGAINNMEFSIYKIPLP
ncbi:L-dopachrome tautomerase-related protein [Pustulibacterium marinum]|nr:L-dopachrome tautomerase-related protein [Pustulibacterium marinum]